MDPRRFPAHFLPLILLLSLRGGLFAQPTLPPEMVAVQGGTFTMGCTAGQGADCQADENPAHAVTLPDFEIGKYEVTQGQWEGLFGNNPSSFNSCGASCPVERVTWFDAAIFCNRLSVAVGFTPAYYSDANFTTVFEGTPPVTANNQPIFWKQNANGYRLPTEAEWEYAARGGNQTHDYKYAGTSDLVALNKYCNYGDGGDGYDNFTSPVGVFFPNELGLHDMSGNVWEWCYDWYGDGFYASSPDCAPVEKVAGSNKVLRGGTWGFDAFNVRVSNRGNLCAPGYRDLYVGFV